MPKITFHGAAREVTGSCYLVEAGKSTRLLLECGMHQGGDDVNRIVKDRFNFKPNSIQGLILSHAHLDHSGLIPKLVHEGFDGPIYCTAATADLLSILLLDAWGLYQRDFERENLSKRRRGRKPAIPVYTEADVKKTLSLCQEFSYGEKIHINNDTYLVFHDAGHILGSSIVELVSWEAGEERTLVFSGDLGNPDSVLMRAPARLSHADVLMMEGTYGDRDHHSMEKTLDELRTILTNTWQQGGNVLIPAFAVGRTQEILFHLGRLRQAGELDDWKIFLDSPMAIRVTKVYDQWLKSLDKKDVAEMRQAHHSNLEDFLPNLKLCETPEESMAINEIGSGAIIIAGSGMCTGGRIRHHIKHRIWQSRTTMVFIGYQVRGTLGRLLVDGVKRIKLFRDMYVVKAKIETLGGFSAHAGQTQLIKWYEQFKKNPKVILVHGEIESLEKLAQQLDLQYQVRAIIPAPHDSIQY